MRGTTGHSCPTSGIWRSTNCPHIEIALSVGEVFPPCKGCKKAITWVLIRATQN